MKKPKIYHDRRPLAIALRVLAAAVLVAVTVCVFSFFWCKRYIVIENGELRLDPPWEASQQSSAAS